jgi:hypothetical protein
MLLVLLLSVLAPFRPARASYVDYLFSKINIPQPGTLSQAIVYDTTVLFPSGINVLQYDYFTGSLLRTLTGHTQIVQSMFLNGMVIYSFSGWGGIVSWDLSIPNNSTMRLVLYNPNSLAITSTSISDIILYAFISSSIVLLYSVLPMDPAVHHGVEQPDYIIHSGLNSRECNGGITIMRCFDRRYL